MPTIYFFKHSRFKPVNNSDILAKFIYLFFPSKLDYQYLSSMTSIKGTSAKGLIFLDSKSAILHEQLEPRLMEAKREPCEISFCDFDDVNYRITCQPETTNIVEVHVAFKHIPLLMTMGTKELLDRLFPGMEIPPADGFHYAIRFDCDAISDGANFLNTVADMKRHIFGGPLDRAFTALETNTIASPAVMCVPYRFNEGMFVCSKDGKVVVVFQVDFADETDKAVAKVFLQEFVEAQRTVRTAPPVSYTKEPPGELAGANFQFKLDSAGFISFALEERHVKGPAKEKAITLLSGFRNYLHYHIKCSKTYLHMRMRKRVVGWMQVLNRAVPEIETEKKTAAGKTFTRK